MSHPVPKLLAAAVAAVLAVPSLADEAPLGDASMAKANSAAAKVVKARMKSERPEDLRWLEKAEAADVVVVSGEYDRVQDVFHVLEIPHTVVTPARLAKMTLNAKQLLIIDCPGYLNAAAIEKVRKFVNAGGFLYTTDWALANVVQKAFPGFVAFNGRPTANDVVEVEVKRTDDKFLNHVQLAKGNPKWWLESSSYPIKVLDKEKVEILISSREMKQRYGESPIAVTFHYGDGQVLHIASHFYLQQNQIRNVAEAKPSKAYVAEDAALGAEVKEELAREKALDGVRAGDLASAYAAQQVTSNMVVERKKDQGRIDGLYDRQMATAAPSPTAPASFGAGAKVKIVEKKGEKLKVRAMDGEEAWISSEQLR